MNNFEFICSKKINEVNKNVSMYKHSSGLSLYYYPDMISNSFGIIIRTKENDNSQVFHILEHMLCRGNKDDKHFELTDLFHEYDVKLKATTSFSNVCLQFENQNTKEYFGLAEVMINSVLNPSLAEEDFLIEGYSVEKNEEGISYITGRVYNEMKNKRTRDIDAYRNFIVNDIKGDTDKDILSVAYEDVLKAYNDYFFPANITIVASGNYKPEILLENLDKWFLKYELSNCKTVIENCNGDKLNKDIVIHEFVNVKESDKIDVSLFYKIGNLSYKENVISKLVLNYFDEYVFENLDDELNKINDGITISSQAVTDENGYNFFNIRIFDVLEENVQSIIFKVKELLSKVEFDSEKLNNIFVRMLIDNDKKITIKGFTLSFLINYLVSSKYSFEEYDEKMFDYLQEMISKKDVKLFDDVYRNIVDENNLYTYIFKNKIHDDNKKENLIYNKNIENMLFKYIQQKQNYREELLNKYVNKINQVDIPDELILDQNEILPENRFKETTISIVNNDSNLSFEKEYLVYLLSLKIKSFLNEHNYILENDVIAKNGQLHINVITENNDIDVKDKILTELKAVDLNINKKEIVNSEKRKKSEIKKAFDKSHLTFSTVSNMLKNEAFNEDAICHLELENKISLIDQIDFNEIRDYLLEGKTLKSFDIKKNIYNNVLLLTNRSSLTSISLDIKNLSLSLEESHTLEKIIKNEIDVEIKQKRRIYGSYVQCSYDLFIIGIYCDNDFKTSLQQIDSIMESFLTSEESLVIKIANYYKSNREKLKTCILLNKDCMQYDRNEFDCIYEFDD